MQPFQTTIVHYSNHSTKRRLDATIGKKTFWRPEPVIPFGGRGIFLQNFLDTMYFYIFSKS
jgi:hypothetical protein